jgi:hypothetical protein
MAGRYYFEYQGSKHLCANAWRYNTGNLFYTLIMAAMREADADNMEALQAAFPDVWDELHQRYNSPGGKLEGEL